MKVTGYRCDVDNQFGEEQDNGGPPPHWFTVSRGDSDEEPALVCSGRCLAKLGREIQAREQEQAEPIRRIKKADMPCPECKRMFGSVLALSIHRSKAHGVTGAQIAEEREQAKKEE